MSHQDETRDNVLGRALQSLPLEPDADDFFDRLGKALDRADPSPQRPFTGPRPGLRSMAAIAATGIACLAVGTLAGAALASRDGSPKPAASLRPTERVGYAVVGNRPIAAFHSGQAPADQGTGGFSLTLPTGWNGRVLFPNDPGQLPVIQAGNFTLPADDSTDGSAHIQPQMGPSDIFIWIADYGRPPAWMQTSPNWPQTNLPIAVSEADDHGTYEGQVVPLFLLRHVIVQDHALLVGVEFGTAHPTTDTYQLVNKTLSTLTLG
jgi:hypothetical protein